MTSQANHASMVQNGGTGEENIALEMVADEATDTQTHGTEHSDVSKRTVQVCVLFVKLGEIDTIREQFSADVLIKSKWREPSLDGLKSESDLSSDVIKNTYWDPKIFVENTIGESKETITHQVTFNAKEEAHICENRRIRGTFVENLELDDFPFDVQDLSVIVASERYSTEVDFVDDPSDLHRVCKRSFVDEQEWCLYKHIEVVKDEYSDDMMMGENHHKKPMYLVRCRAARRPWYFLVNMYSFTFLIVALSLATFSVAWNKPENRLQLSFTLLLTSVAFKLVINQSLPKISYMTFLDQYTYVATLMMVFICAWHAFSSLLTPDVAIVAQNTALAIFVFCYAIYNILYALYIYITVYRKRRILSVKDSDYLLRMKSAQDQAALHSELSSMTHTIMTLDFNLSKFGSTATSGLNGKQPTTPEEAIIEPDVSVTARIGM